eukprot:GHVO01033968.1.p1 GENE.GHVO01033968.1~~GHVO01033968.1.p1  ORF type:complete len:378 (+),score=88.16 GHVO01033968.1:400-1533(+)
MSKKPNATLVSKGTWLVSNESRALMASTGDVETAQHRLQADSIDGIWIGKGVGDPIGPTFQITSMDSSSARGYVFIGIGDWSAMRRVGATWHDLDPDKSGQVRAYQQHLTDEGGIKWKCIASRRFKDACDSLVWVEACGALVVGLGRGTVEVLYMNGAGGLLFDRVGSTALHKATITHLQAAQGGGAQSFLLVSVGHERSIKISEVTGGEVDVKNGGTIVKRLASADRIAGIAYDPLIACLWVSTRMGLCLTFSTATAPMDHIHTFRIGESGGNILYTPLGLLVPSGKCLKLFKGNILGEDNYRDLCTLEKEVLGVSSTADPSTIICTSRNAVCFVDVETGRIKPVAPSRSGSFSCAVGEAGVAVACNRDMVVWQKG